MANLKTQATQASVSDFLAQLPEAQYNDCQMLMQMMGDITQQTATMWGTSIVGFGAYQYEYKSGHCGRWFWVGFAPRKQNLTLYLMAGFEQYGDLLQQLGKYKAGQSCLYIKRLSEVQLDILRQLITQTVANIKTQYPLS